MSDVVKDLRKWLMVRKNQMLVVIFLVMIVAMNVDFSHWASSIPVSAMPASGIKPGGGGGDDDDEPLNYTLSYYNETVTLTGTVSGGPATLVADDIQEFEVNETAYKLDITLTWNPQATDLDLEVLDAKDKVVASSGNAPGEPEHCVIEKKTIRSPGMWKIAVDPFATLGASYTCVIIITYEVMEECEGGICPI